MSAAHVVTFRPTDLEDAGERQQIDGIDVEIYLSVFDKPTAVSVANDAARNELVIAFRYPDQEAPARSAKTSANKVRIVEGRYTGKLLELRVPLHHRQLSSSALKDQLDLALDERAHPDLALKPLSTVGRRLNQRVARGLLDRSIAELQLP